LRRRLPIEIAAYAYGLAACWLNRARALMQLGDVAHRDLASQIIGVSHAAGIIDTLQPEPECDSTLLGKTLR
jgi:hypothetical protein